MNLLKESFLYAIGYLFSRFQYFFILPFLLKKISTVDYGIIESLSVLQLFILVLVVNNFDTSVSSYYYEDEKNQKNLEAVGFLSCLINSLILFSLFFLFSNWWTKILLGFDHYKIEFLLAVGWALMNSIIHYNSFLLRMQKKIKQFSFLLIFQGSISLGLIFYFTVIKFYGIKGYLWGNLIGALLTSLISYIQVNYDFKITSFRETFSKLFKLAIPMFPVSISAWSLTLIDRVLLGKFGTGGLSDVGVYGFAVKMATLGSVLWGPFQLAWMPYALSSFKNEESVKMLEKASSWFFYFSYLVITLITLLSPLIIHLFFPAQYQSAVRFIGPLILCNFFNIAYYLPYTSLIQMKKLHLVTLAFVVASVINLILNFVLIPPLGITGAVVANFGGYLTILAITNHYSHAENYPAYFKKEQLLILCCFICTILPMSFIRLESNILRVMMSLAFCLMITVVFARFKLIELSVLRNIVKQRIKIM